MQFNAQTLVEIIDFIPVVGNSFEAGLGFLYFMEQTTILFF